MDKHICRAKDIHTGKWVYGYYVCVLNEHDHDVTHLIIDKDCAYQGFGEFWWRNNHV